VSTQRKTRTENGRKPLALIEKHCWAEARSPGESIFARLINAPRDRAEDRVPFLRLRPVILRESSREIYERHTCNWSIEVIRADRRYLLNARENYCAFRSNAFSPRLTHDTSLRGTEGWKGEKGLNYFFFFSCLVSFSRSFSAV